MLSEAHEGVRRPKASLRQTRYFINPNSNFFMCDKRKEAIAGRNHSVSSHFSAALAMRTSRAGLKLIVVVVVVVVVPVTNPLFERDKLIHCASLSSSSLHVGRKEVLFRNYSAPWYKARLLKPIMPRATATFNGQIIAEADTYEQVEGNVYFPPESIKNKHALSDAELTTFCPWKGTASYYNITVDGKPGLGSPQ